MFEKGFLQDVRHDLWKILSGWGRCSGLRRPNSGEIYRKWGVQIAGMIFQTGSKPNKEETWKKNN